MATVIMALLYVLEGAILTVTAVVTGIKHSEFPDVRVGYHVRDAMESKEKWNDANVIAGLVSGVFAVIFFAAAILVYWNRIDTDRSIALFFILSVISIGSVLLIPAYLLKMSARLRKKAKTVIRNSLIAVFVIAAAWIGWLCAYYNTKNADNLPTLENLQTEDLDDLVGYQRGQLISVWDQPDDTISIDQDVWRLEGEEYLLVTYGINGKVKEAEFVIP